MKRRMNNEGSWGTKTINSINYVFFRKTYVYFDGTTEDKYFYGATSSEVNHKRQKFEKSLNQTRLSPSTASPQLTFGQYIENWLYNEKTATVQEGTFDGYETAIRVRIKNFKGYDLWNKQLSQINSDPAVGINIFKSYIDALREHGYSLKTIKEVATLISQCCAYASNPMRNDLAYNYMDYVTLPTEATVKTHKKEIHFMSEAEMHVLYNEAKRVNLPTEGGTGTGKLVYSNNGYAIILIMYTGFLIFISYMVYFPPKTNLFIRCTVAWIIGPDIKTVIIVQIPKLPPSKTPITTIATSNIIRTILTGHPFFPARENVTAS